MAGRVTERTRYLMKHKDLASKILDNPYLELLPEAVEEILKLIFEFAESAKSKKHKTYALEMADFLHEMEQTDADFIFFLQQQQKKYRCKLGFYARFLSILKAPKYEQKEYKYRRKKTRLYNVQREILDNIIVLISEMQELGTKKISKRTTDDIWKRKGQKSKVHFFLRFGFKSPEDIVKYAVEQKLSLNMLQGVIKKHCEQGYREYGYFTEKDDQGRIVIRHIKHGVPK